MKKQVSVEPVSIEKVPGDVISHMFSYLGWRDLAAVSMMNREWRRLGDKQKNFWKTKLKEEKGVDFDPRYFPEGFLESHPIDLRALYLKIRHIPRDKLFNNSAFYYYRHYLVFCALVGGQTFWDALALHGRPEGLSSELSYYIAGTFAISGDLESLQKFDQGSLAESGILLEGAVQGGSLQMVQWLLDENCKEEYRGHYLQECYGWAIEYRQKGVLELLETKYEQSEPVIEDDPWFCLNKAICSDSVTMVSRFVNPEKMPTHFLHIAAQANAANVFWYGVKTLGLDINQVDDNGWMPIHHAANRGHVALFRAIANSDCCLQLRQPQYRAASHQQAYYQLLKNAARESSGQILRVLHREFHADFSVIDPETGNCLAHEVGTSFNHVQQMGYLILYCNVDWDHKNNDGKTVRDCLALQDDSNPFFYNHNSHYYYAKHAQVIHYLIKALSNDDDANEFTATLLRYHQDHPEDAVACLALALVFKDDPRLCEQYQSLARENNPDSYNQAVDIMVRISGWLQNITTIDTDCLKKRSACSIM